MLSIVFKYSLLTVALLFCFVKLMIAQERLVRTYYDFEEKNLKEEYEANWGDAGWEKNGYYRSFYPSGKIALEGYFKKNIKNGWFREYYDTVIKQKVPIKSQVFYRDGKKEGLMCIFSINGDTLQKAFFQDDQLTGKIWVYHENGKIKREAYFLEGKLEGVVKEYYENGSLFKEISFVNGRQHGKSRTYYPSGNLHYEEQFVNGLQEGLQKEFYDLPSSPILAIFTMKSNAKEGQEIIYNLDGKVIAENSYHLGALHGKVRRWDSLAREIIYEAYYENGYRKGTEIERYPNGKIYRITRYNNNEKEKSVAVYDTTGKAVFEGSYINNLLHGLVKEKTDSLYTEVYYQMGKRHGNFIFFYLQPEGQIHSKGKYINNLLDGVYQEYYEDGKIKLKGNYRMGRKVGKWHIYDRNQKEKIEKY